jgi:hypothetical protein
VSSRGWRCWVPPLVLLVAATLPALSLLGHPGAVLAGPDSEVWVKLWAFETFTGTRLFGGDVHSVGFPNTGLLNNADTLGTIVHSLLRPLIGRVVAYNLLVLGQLWAAMLAAWLLARDLTRDPVAAIVAGVGFGLTPLVLVYPLACGITDILQLWPYPLALLFGLRALRLGGWRDGLLAGCFAGAGFVTCPHNFVVFASVSFPLLLWLPLAWRRGLLPVPDGPAAPPLQRLPRVGLALALGVALTAGWYVLWMKLLLVGPGAQVSEELVAGTSHIPPYRMLHPAELKRFTAFASEYFLPGRGALVERDMVSRFYRSFYLGWVLMGLAGLGVVLARGRRLAVGLWPFVALFCAVAALGPFMPWSASLRLDVSVNPAWLALHHLLPGAKLILEPFRYVLPAALALSVAAAVGVAWLARRLGAWVGLVAPLLVVTELLLFSPVPVPLPTAEVRISPAYGRLDEALPPGAIIELPYFDQGTQRFERSHFLQQLRHGRPIADEIVGFPPRYLVHNQFTAQLIGLEKPYGELVIRVEFPDRIAQDRERLVQDGFVGIVLDPDGFDSAERCEQVMDLLSVFGAPVLLEDRLVYRLVPPAQRDVVHSPTGE